MKVIVEFTTCRKLDDGCETTQFNAVGLLEETERGLCLRYVEPPDEETEHDGAAVRVTVSGGRLTIERQSSTINSCMVLEAGCPHPCRYDTLYGALDLRVLCDEVRNELTPRGGSVAARYRVDTPGVEAFENTMEITVKEVSE